MGNSHRTLRTRARLGAFCVSCCFLVLVCVRTQCVPSLATRVVAKIYELGCVAIQRASVTTRRAGGTLGGWQRRSRWCSTRRVASRRCPPRNWSDRRSCCTRVPAARSCWRAARSSAPRCSDPTASADQRSSRHGTPSSGSSWRESGWRTSRRLPRGYARAACGASSITPLRSSSTPRCGSRPPQLPPIPEPAPKSRPRSRARARRGGTTFTLSSSSSVGCARRSAACRRTLHPLCTQCCATAAAAAAAAAFSAGASIHTCTRAAPSCRHVRTAPPDARELRVRARQADGPRAAQG